MVLVHIKTRAVLKTVSSSFLSLLLAVLIGIGPSPVFSNTDSQEISAPQRPVALTPPTEQNFYKSFAQAMGDLPPDIQQQISEEVLGLYYEMLELQVRLEKQYGEQGLVTILSKGGRDSEDKPIKRAIQKSNVGRAEFYVIDNQTFVRIIHDLSSTAIFMIDNPETKLDTRHMKTVMARQHLATNSPAPGLYKGRDMAIWRINRVCQSVECQLSEKPERFTRQHLLEYFRSIRAKNNPYDLVLGFLLGSFQAGALFEIKKLGDYLSENQLLSQSILEGRREITTDMMAVAFGFGLVTTLIKPTFDNWRNKGSPNMINYSTEKVEGNLTELKNELPLIQRVKEKSSNALRSVYQTVTSQQIRRSTLSYAHRTSLIFMAGNAGTLDVSIESLVSFAQLTGNIIIGNYASYWWEQPAHIRAKPSVRLNKRPLFKGPENETPAEASKRFQMDLLEKQVRYNIAWLIGMIDFLNVTTIEVPYLGFISVWKIVMLASASVARWRAVLAAERYHDPDAAQMRKDFENSWYMRGLKKIFGNTELGQYMSAYHKTFVQPKLDTAIKPVIAAQNGAKLMCNRVFNTDFK
ncbi:MAG: hypothetical protein AB7F59_07710 [Bdellovibrionales bacterium]